MVVNPLRLIAEDPADLEVVSAALQDALAQVGDIRFEARARTLSLVLNRFRWEGQAKRGGERVRAALQLSGVMAVQAKRLRREPKDAVVSLMSIAFDAGEEPGGMVTMTFAGGGELVCTVECLDVMLADLGQPWPTRNRPEHGDVV